MLFLTGEDIGQAACREVYEETGVKCEFIGVICFRHQHEFRDGNSDLYFICLMKPLTQEITMCPQEIYRAQWMDVSTEYEILTFNQGSVNTILRLGDLYLLYSQ